MNRLSSHSIFWDCSEHRSKRISFIVAIPLSGFTTMLF